MYAATRGYQVGLKIGWTTYRGVNGLEKIQNLNQSKLNQRIGSDFWILDLELNFKNLNFGFGFRFSIIKSKSNPKLKL